MNNLEMQQSKGVWTTDDDKSIPFVKESYAVISDEFNNYSIEITRWSKNTTIQISVVSGDRGIDDEWETRSVTEKIYNLAKLPHAEFDVEKAELIEKAINFIEELHSST